MNEELIMKYSIGIGIALACFIAFLAISFLHDKQKKRRRNIIIHIIQAILLCSLVAIVSQYCEMAVVDFKLHFISFQMINFFSYLAIALILMRK
ncbi:mechanosensitive ion channel protein MscS, partial [Salmonella enterica subsp. enterica serovar Takoradi]|nr:mechanosensitive ion channel protein MscS [Salmonella enterica subsp. enterica serovar Takoradi]